MTDQDTDPIPEEDDPAYGFWATLVGLPLLERRLLKRIEVLIGTNEADQKALAAAAATLRAADVTVDAIEPEPFNHKQKKGTKP